jgi:nicotinamidase-related amidase
VCRKSRNQAAFLHARAGKQPETTGETPHDALLVVDVINTFDHEDGELLLSSFRRRANEIAAVLRRYRDGGTPVIYVNDAAGRWDGDAPAHVRRAAAARGGDVVSRLAPASGDLFLFKRRYSAFDGTPLRQVLGELEVERVLLIGAATEGCVVQTGIDAREQGLKATILAAACATVDEEVERIALEYAERVVGIRVDRGAAAPG